VSRAICDTALRIFWTCLTREGCNRATAPPARAARSLSQIDLPHFFCSRRVFHATAAPLLPGKLRSLGSSTPPLSAPGCRFSVTGGDMHIYPEQGEVGHPPDP
jgi:hypothetical protein